MTRYLKILLFAVLIAVVAVIFLDIFWHNPQAEGFFVITRGDNVLQIASNLKSQGYIGSRLIFIGDAVSSGNFRKMKAGRYEISKGSTSQDLIEKFTKFQSASINILIVPGKTTNDIARILAQGRLVKKDEFLDLVLRDKLEGYLFPDNYLIDPGATAQDIIKQILDNFDKKLTDDLKQAIEQQHRTVADVITMASILEKEVKTYHDKQMVAGILWKRAENNLPLQVDSTLLYFLTSAHPNLIDKSVESPYNTYKYAGLPVGPICSPGIESIRAAIYLINSDYWFYLSTPDGETIFAETLGQHLINKAKYLTN
ncbi:MAG: endolytic transglycosylase MltG [Candidatus Gribaldobacteria bacterium]|nr:endolytic transglycosylase MltG [Candidatus Gribaldobacteria bacterium]